MPILYMQTEQVRTYGQRLMLMANTLSESAQGLTQSQSMLQSEWDGNSAVEFESELQQLLQGVRAYSDSANNLGVRLKNEADEWEQVDQKGASSFQGIVAKLDASGQPDNHHGGTQDASGGNLPTDPRVNELADKYYKVVDDLKNERDRLLEEKLQIEKAHQEMIAHGMETAYSIVQKSIQAGITNPAEIIKELPGISFDSLRYVYDAIQLGFREMNYTDAVVRFNNVTAPQGYEECRKILEEIHKIDASWGPDM